MLFLLSLLFVTNISHASEETCPYTVERREEIQFQQLWSEDSQSCYFSVSPRDAYVDLIYRDYLFSSSGLFMVFNSYGPGDEAQTTAAREFYMFPRTRSTFVAQWDDENRELKVTHVTGDQFVFNYKRANLKSITRANITVAPDVVPTNRGGIEISNFQGLILDGGFKQGGAPTGSPNATSVFKDVAGKTCAVKNAEVFKYTSQGDVIFRFDDKGLKSFLRGRCSSLSF
ncbi:MAG: hypothetical protein HUU57_01940 [Bdellovibrio sp.]|nr:hypothetical protein [Bdellovibrio sp.]